MKKRRYDKFGFEIFDDEMPLDYTSTDDDYGDMDEYERPWYEEEDVCLDEYENKELEDD